MNGSNAQQPSTTGKTASPKPPPAGPAPAVAPPPPPTSAAPKPAAQANVAVNGAQGHAQQAQKGKKKAPEAIDPATMYETVKNRIAALEEEEVHEEEEERRIGLVFFQEMLNTV